MQEEKLPFGNVSNTVKIGDNVHRDTGAWTPSIHALLHYLQVRHFEYAPRVVGSDDKGREILSYLEGEAAVRPWPSVLLGSSGIQQAAALLRHYHDIVADFQPPADAEWRVGKLDLRPGQVILHGDLGPWNTIWQSNTLTGLIDWDFAHPGDRMEDLAQMACYFIPLRNEEGWRKAGFETRPDFASRLKTLVKAYGMYTPQEVIDGVFKYLEDDYIRTESLAEQGIEPWAHFVKRGDLEEILKDTHWLKMVYPELL